MPAHQEKRIVPYTQEQMFALVADIARYPEFLPWCLKARILENDERTVKAELLVGTKTFRERYTSLVTLEPFRAIRIAYLGGALKNLESSWHFAPSGAAASELSFFVAFEMNSRFLAALMDLFFETAFRRMVKAFEKRAETLYGTPYDK